MNNEHINYVRTSFSFFLMLFLVAALNLPVLSQNCASPGPLRINKKNPRYFTDESGKAIYLTGSHTWNNLVDMRPENSEANFDFSAYLDFLEKHNHNFIRLWAWELMHWNTSGNSPDNPRIHLITVFPFERTGPGKAFDGRQRFDLTKLNETYFQRLRQRVEMARQRNIYVSVMLFEGWGLQFSPNAFKSHPFHPENNINGLELDTASQNRLRIHEISSPKVLAIQESYVKRVLQTLNDLDNVLYEISNETQHSSTAWQDHMVKFIRDQERLLGCPHPVGITYQEAGGSNKTLFESGADWISPNKEGGYRDDPPENNGEKIILNDTDHLWGIGGNHQWVWKSFLRGLHPIFMDPYDGAVFNEGYDSKALKTEIELVRRNMGYTLTYAKKINLTDMVPASDIAASVYCLAEKNKEYLLYIVENSSVELDLTNARTRFRVEWFNPISGKTTNGGSIKGGKKVSLHTPFKTKEAVLYLKAEQ